MLKHMYLILDTGLGCALGEQANINSHDECMSCSGDDIPPVQYLPEEVKTWGAVLRELKQLYPQHACQEFLQNFPKFNFREEEVPQLQDRSNILRSAVQAQRGK